MSSGTYCSREISFIRFPKSCIDVHLTILQEDGSALAACVNAAAAALVDAGIPIKDMFSACSTGVMRNCEYYHCSYAVG